MTPQTGAKHSNIAVFVPHNGCPHTCSFCNQRTISGHSAQPSPEEVSALLSADFERLKEKSGSPEGRELAFFGGSFTAIDRQYMTALLATAQPYLGVSISGIRCSTRPDCIDSDILACLCGYGVTAVELGAQSMDDNVLALNHRGHTAAHVERSSRLIREQGIELGLQMMTGLYGDTPEGARRTGEALADLQPATVRIYPTVVLRGTELARLYEAGEYIPQTVEQAVDICTELLELFGSRNIRVIRLGLHASKDVEENYIAGAYHPALRELCQSRMMLSRMTGMLDGADENVIRGFAVNPSDLSKAIGQRRSNLEKLRRRVKEIVIISDPDVPADTVKIIYKQ